MNGRVSPKELAKLLDYDPDTGRLTWKRRETQYQQWNTRYAGKEAFTTTSTSNGYRQGGIHGKKYSAHRVAWAIYHGEWPPEQIDHISGDKSDNRIVNLRSVSQAENGKNTKRHSNNKSGFSGVFWLPRNRRWCVRIRVGGKFKYFGSYQDLSEAAAVSATAYKEFGFHENHGREGA